MGSSVLTTWLLSRSRYRITTSISSCPSCRLSVRATTRRLMASTRRRHRRFARNLGGLRSDRCGNESNGGNKAHTFWAQVGGNGETRGLLYSSWFAPKRSVSCFFRRQAYIQVGLAQVLRRVPLAFRQCSKRSVVEWWSRVAILHF